MSSVLVAPHVLATLILMLMASPWYLPIFVPYLLHKVPPPPLFPWIQDPTHLVSDLTVLTLHLLASFLHHPSRQV